MEQQQNAVINCAILSFLSPEISVDTGEVSITAYTGFKDRTDEVSWQINPEGEMVFQLGKESFKFDKTKTETVLSSGSFVTRISAILKGAVNNGKLLLVDHKDHGHFAIAVDSVEDGTGEGLLFGTINLASVKEVAVFTADDSTQTNKVARRNTPDERSSFRQL